MKYYTSDDYDSLVRYTYKEISELNDVSENYKLNNTKDKHHKHDKLFRKILNDKNEVAKKMLAEKIDINLISKLTGLRKEQFMQ